MNNDAPFFKALWAELRQMNAWEIIWGACQLMVAVVAIWLLTVGLIIAGNLVNGVPAQ